MNLNSQENALHTVHSSLPFTSVCWHLPCQGSYPCTVHGLAQLTVSCQRLALQSLSQSLCYTCIIHWLQQYPLLLWTVYISLAGFLPPLFDFLLLLLWGGGRRGSGRVRNACFMIPLGVRKSLGLGLVSSHSMCFTWERSPTLHSSVIPYWFLHLDLSPKGCDSYQL